MLTNVYTSDMGRCKDALKVSEKWGVSVGFRRSPGTASRQSAERTGPKQQPHVFLPRHVLSGRWAPGCPAVSAAGGLKCDVEGRGGLGEEWRGRRRTGRSRDRARGTDPAEERGQERAREGDSELTDGARDGCGGQERAAGGRRGQEKGSAASPNSHSGQLGKDRRAALLPTRALLPPERGRCRPEIPGSQGMGWATPRPRGILTGGEVCVWVGGGDSADPVTDKRGGRESVVE
ncbi:hypothetical protein NDU88_010518 [Pleurodeles waltl]|uniref:Uncharacterized protein n=1 Tax=Pleurodeles waltl TaxID=8319 RepID=A0AAV7RYF7_PLEWA|nr:hypothetical protein NDU88_010518 [Pleurodeles waltl]